MYTQVNKSKKTLNHRCFAASRKAAQFSRLLRKVLFYAEPLRGQLTSYADRVCTCIAEASEYEKNTITQLDKLRDAKINAMEVQQRLVTATHHGRLDACTSKLFYVMYSQIVDELTELITELPG